MMLTDCIGLSYILPCVAVAACVVNALTELSLPEDVNIFYAVDLRSSAPLELVVRYKTNTFHHRSRQDSKPSS